nr:hypothetical protein [Dickeya chrysanthemi]
LSPEASRWLVKFVSDEFVTLLPRYKALMSLALTGQRVALFKTQRVLSCNSNYFGYKPPKRRLFTLLPRFRQCGNNAHCQWNRRKKRKDNSR